MGRRRVVESSDEDEGGPSQSQSASSTQLSSTDKKTLAAAICNYLLLNECKKIPSKRNDMRKLVLKDKGRHFSDVMAEASALMKMVYGYRVVQLKNKDSYILSNTLKMDDKMVVNSITTNEEIKGLLTIVLSAIFMSGGIMQEGPMREYLKNFSIDLDSKAPHPVFGNIDRLFHQDLPKQCYLEITLDKAMDPPSREYRWGERAHLELPKKHVLELVCKVYDNNMRPEMWTSQWKAVQDEEN